MTSLKKTLSSLLLMLITTGCTALVKGTKQQGPNSSETKSNSQDTSGGSADGMSSSKSNGASVSDTYSTKTTYKPQQDADSYEAPPAGFAPVFVQMISRHSSRGLSSMDSELIVYNMVEKAKAENALTPLGVELGTDMLELMSVNTLLGSGLEGITKPGYGNLSQLGMREHQDLATRMSKRLKPHFERIVTSQKTEAPMSVKVSTSGVNRAQDSAFFFTQSLAKNIPGLSPAMAPSSPVEVNPTGPAKPAGINRYLLYFHKLNAEEDLVVAGSPDESYGQIYQESQAYQAYKDDAIVKAKIKTVHDRPENVKAARIVLERLFKKDFVDKLESGTYTFSNVGTFTFKSKDGAYTASSSGDGESTSATLIDAALHLYSAYVIGPALAIELGKNYEKYIPEVQARIFAFLSETEDFYEKGPGILERNKVTSNMALGLVADFFDETDHIADGELSHGAYLRFAHAETLVPFVTALELKGVSQAVPEAEIFSYEKNPWRGSVVSPLTGNVQWDVFQNFEGRMLVKMLYNEKETEFKPACDSAKIVPKSFYYDYERLKLCYNQ